MSQHDASYRTVCNVDGSFTFERVISLETAEEICEDMHYIIGEQAAVIRRLKQALGFVHKKSAIALNRIPKLPSLEDLPDNGDPEE